MKLAMAQLRVAPTARPAVRIRGSNYPAGSSPFQVRQKESDNQAAGERMVSIIIQRLARERQNSQSVVQNEVEEDLRPDFLKQFPNAAEMYKDMKLGVLLGR
jgi:hypothetical protein